MTELLTCPFCGGEAEVVRNDIGVFLGCFNEDCPIGPATSTYVDGYATEAEAIAAWNTRAERTCEPPYDELLRCLENDWNISASWDGLRRFWHIGLTEEGVRLRDAELNSRAERTCECVAEHASSPIDGKTIVLHRCSACHNLMRPTMLYCPNCGARVEVGE